MSEQKIKLCPFRKIHLLTNVKELYQATLGEYAEDFQPCLQEQCALYLEDCKCCGLKLS